MFLKIVSGLLASMMVFSPVGTIADPPVTRQSASVNPPAMVLQYDEPASSTNRNDTWQQATLPIGNGIIGANVYGELATEHLTVNEETLWSGGRGSVSNYNGGNPSSSKVSTYEGYANRLLNGEILTGNGVSDLAGVSQSASGYNNGYQALGDLYVDVSGAPSSKPSDYRRTLDLENGLATVSYGSASRTFFVSNPDNVLVSRFEGSNVGLTVSFASKHNSTTSTRVSGGVGYITVAGTVSNNGLLHNTQIAVVPTGGSVSVSSNKLTVSGASAVTIYLTSATDYKNTYWDDAHTTAYYYRTGETAAQLSSRVSSKLNAAVNKGYDAVLSAHQADYKALYGRVKLDLGQSSSRMTDELLNAYKNGTATVAEQRYLEVLMFQYGRYLLIAGSRENSQLPTTLQGIWNNSNTAPWYSDIHTNINEQMNYWLSGNCNLTECALPLVQYVADLAIPGHRTVEIYTGSTHGIMAHTQNTPFGYTSPGWTIGTWGWSPAASTWLMQNCYDYYEFSGDVDTLRTVIYPYLKDQVLMYKDLLKSYNGRMVMPITQSPEIDKITAGNTYEQSLIWQLFADTIEAAGVLGVDSDLVPEWQSLMDQLKPIEIGTSGQIKEWYSETTINSVEDTSGHRHLSNMLGLYPGNLIDTDAEIAAATVSLNNKNFGRVGTSNNPEGGWTYGQLINSWARVFNGENAYFSVKQMIKNRLYANLWDWHSGSTYGSFQIDANYGYSAGVGEMLVQSNLGYINMLPAIPSAWANGSVDGLLCEGNFTVSMNWADGALTSGTIRSGKGGSLSVKLQPFQILKDASGNVVGRYNAANPIVTVNTAVGDVLTVESSKLHVSAERVWDGSVNLTWNAQNGESYTVSANGTVITSNITGGTFTHTDAPLDAVTYTVSTQGDNASASVDAVIQQTYSVADCDFERVALADVTEGTYLIVGARPSYSANKAVKADRSMTNIASYVSGTDITRFDGVEDYLWTITPVSGGYTIQSQKTGMYLTMPNSNTYPAGVGDSAVTLQMGSSSYYTGAVYIQNKTVGAYLNYRQDGDGVAGTWTGNDQGSSWYLYRVKDPDPTYEQVSTLSDGTYVITGANAGVSTGHAVKSDLSAPSISGYVSGTTVNSFSGVESYEWEIKAVSGGYTVRSVSSNAYLRMSNGDTTKTDTSTSPVMLEIAPNSHFAGSYYIKNPSSGAHLNYRTNNSGSAGTWTDADGGSAWYLFLRHDPQNTFVISPEVLSSAAAAAAGMNSPAVDAALAAAQGEFTTAEEAAAAYQALLDALRGLTTCQHAVTHTENAKEATCTEPGYTGDTVCDSCGETVETGSVIDALGHYASNVRTGAVEATCTTPGYTGDVHCVRCDALMAQGTTIPALGHAYENGTCTRCGESEPTPIEPGMVEIAPGKGNGVKIALTGTSHMSTAVDGQGFVIMETSKLAGRELTVDTPGRTHVIVRNVRADGTWIYSYSPKGTTTEYTVRSYVRCGDTYYYSEPTTVTYNRVKNG